MYSEGDGARVLQYAARDSAAPTYRGGLGAARLRRVTEFIQAGLERDLTLVDLAQSVGLSTAHFAVMFRQSTGQTPHQFVLRCRMERAKEMLRTEKARIVDVAVAWVPRSTAAFRARVSPDVRSRSSRISVGARREIVTTRRRSKARLGRSLEANRSVTRWPSGPNQATVLSGVKGAVRRLRRP